VMLAGFGESSDAHHISAPHPEGDGAVAAMCAALEDANICAADIDYVNLHGTATPKNDAMESLAMTRVFDPLPPLSSTKPLTGHALGAAGALEAAFCCLLLSRFNPELRLPPQVWDGAQDPQNPVLPLVQAGQIAARLSTVMSNSFAFGGSNASLIFCRAGQDSTHQSENPEHD
jgi:3-oxoacyl-[acyl-carrier-protein] synthase I